MLAGLKTENKVAPFSVIHTLGSPLDFNGNIARTLGEAVHVARLGIDVRIVVSDEILKTCFEQASENEVKLSLLKPYFPFKRIGWRLNNLLPLFKATLKVVHDNPNSILHICAPSPVTKPLTASALGKRFKKQIVLDLHDPWSGNPFSLNPILVLQTQIMRCVINMADRVIVAHSHLAKLVKRLNREKPTTVIPNGVDINLYRPTKPKKSIAKSLGISHEEVVVAFCGHLTETKGLDVLVRSAKIVLQKYKNIRFLIIGDGPFAKPIQNLTTKLGVHRKFKFVGFVPQRMLPMYLSRADMCVAPYKPMQFYKISLPETPMKVVEYMAMGKPVIMSKISDENVIAWSGGGVQTPPGDVTKLASCIASLVTDEEMRKKLGKRGRDYAEKNLSWEKIALRLVKLYRTLYEERTSSCND